MKKTTVQCNFEETLTVEEGPETCNLGISDSDDDGWYVVLPKDEARRVARALSPLYAVKSAAECYATFGAVEGGEYVNDLTNLTWTEDRSKAALFGTKEGARAMAGACDPRAGARVVRVKR